MIGLPVLDAPPVAAGEFDTEPEVRFPLVAIADARGGVKARGHQLDHFIGDCSKLDSDAGAFRGEVFEKPGAGLAVAGDLHNVRAEVARVSPPLHGWLRLRSLWGGTAGGHIRGAS